MVRLARSAPAAVRRWQLDRVLAVVSHHRRVDGPYSRLLAEADIPEHWRPNDLADLAAIPPIDKQFLRTGGFAQRPAVDAPVTVVSTSGTTSDAVAVPHTADSLRAGLGDNFGRAFVAAGVGFPQRPWLVGHWEESAREANVRVSGSYISMTWLAEVAASALLRNSTSPAAVIVEEAVAFAPTVVASSPNLLATLAHAALAKGHHFGLRAVLYGGAAATEEHRVLWQRAFAPAQMIAFYPTTDAGALGVSPEDSGVYQTFTETHLVEVLDDAGHHVGIGERGRLAVTAYRSLAAPIIRYQVGDSVVYEGTEANRVLISSIRRLTDAAIGDTLVPLEVIDAWTSALTGLGHVLSAVQLVCRTDAAARDQPVVRLVGAASPSRQLEEDALGLLRAITQLHHEIRHGSVAPPIVEFVDSTVDSPFKSRSFVDERGEPFKERRS
jgi:phenylacetate-coenzyme A ligase PaaK-like adenylate-forming protein